ncbi:uncharacterized protein LOC119575819 [Penaeus monodon]|uniref:uncharacterized protein LOC119575819 n=1 Tax=Penaeus monodon TaxID=6687 RepID=UPI0018A6FAA4|nr:uncharacterized protein LOC119575819 [Penaeus monodon]
MTRVRDLCVYNHTNSTTSVMSNIQKLQQSNPSVSVGHTPRPQTKNSIYTYTRLNEGQPPSSAPPLHPPPARLLLPGGVPPRGRLSRRYNPAYSTLLILRHEYASRLLGI